MQTNLAERIALVTGASSGLGSQFARVLAANGALVVLAARRLERLKELRAEIESQGGEASVVQVDVTDLDSIAMAVSHVESEVGPIDILINNSGVSSTQRLTEVTPVDFDFVFNTNTRGAFFVAQEVAKRMIARSKQAQDFRGRIDMVLRPDMQTPELGVPREQDHRPVGVRQPDDRAHRVRGERVVLVGLPTWSA